MNCKRILLLTSFTLALVACDEQEKNDVELEQPIIYEVNEKVMSSSNVEAEAITNKEGAGIWP